MSFPRETSARARLSVFLKGMAMGVADAVPGVSGGTIAVITGIYEQLVNALRRCNPVALSLLWKQGPRALWTHIDGAFLLSLGLGILGSLLLMANLVLYLLEHHFMLVMAFFMGLVLASSWLLNKQVGMWSMIKVLLFCLGFAVTGLTALLNPAAGSDSLVYIFFSGLIAICAMILPGISGAFILLLLGVYEYVLDALRDFNLPVIAVFAAGCAIGLLSFSHVLSLTFYYYREQTYAVLTGMLAASLIVLWPGNELVASAGVSGQLLAVALSGLGAAVIVLFARYTQRA
ncbi:DUF368 domain-containing protein [Pseudohongiella sp. SYSU M77423]|uniref:DUF368 domain-containing protein n=1 Tax=unclassified Pseudohongiella TaxID=2629611 RepID=UPI000C8A05BD|nr:MULTISPECIES: DUF368 domain-containing protein [unclassified Pseudohongiella]MAY56975.1 DUF368 domain-containing protein [Gammaproteobacteria bacterium]MDH7943247.1 DUF368 domain-containing protein [Pseudohongiella sp. SYSU M77423]MEC8860971.1 DUF368 domain-containing protein [Pseudomonadota bacterium]HBN14669.1 DUF368 domain-containing protein [Pseudohongiella sp.]|tara:strand:+ start:2629 stop:3495 length:867 start_codon:yes stop_codon:yes gene_type:complete